MAATKKAIAGIDEEMNQPIEAEEVKKPVKKATKEADPWEQMVEIRVPKTADGSSNHIIASVNGRVFKVMKGVNVKVPAPIAEVIEHSFEAEEAAELFIASHAN